MFYISAPELDHLQIRWPVLRSEGDKSRNWVFQNLFDNCIEYFTKKHLWQNRRKRLACLEAWFHKEVVDMRPGLYTAIVCPPLKSISCWSCSLFPWFWKASINIFLSIHTKPASLNEEYFRFSNQDLDITDLRQSLFIINNQNMSKDFLGQHTSSFWFFFARR